MLPSLWADPGDHELLGPQRKQTPFWNHLTELQKPRAPDTGWSQAERVRGELSH